MPADHLYSFGPFTLDLAERKRILKNGIVVPWWSRRRFKLLNPLLEAKGKVVTWDTLAETVWAGRDVLFHSITKTANDLKSLLDECGDCIQNQHGKGY